MESKVLENLETIKEMSKEKYEAFVVALLIFEKEGEDHIPNQETIDLYRGVYDEFLSNDSFDLLHDGFEDVISNQKELIENEKLEEKSSKIINIKTQER